MKFQRILRRAVVGLACLGMVAPQATAFAGNQAAATRTQLADVSLAKGGVLSGQIVNRQGKAVAGANVVVTFAGAVVARTRADQNGKYAVKGLRGGVHRVNGSVARFWAQGTAPKTARTNMLSVAGTVVRGQNYIPAPGYDPNYIQQGQVVQQGPVVQGPVVDAGPVVDGGTFITPGYGGGFGMLDAITLATVGTSTAALIYAIDTNNELDDLNNSVSSP